MNNTTFWVGHEGAACGDVREGLRADAEQGSACANPEVQEYGIEGETGHHALEQPRLGSGPAANALPRRGQQEPGKQNQFGSEIHQVTAGNPTERSEHGNDSQCGNIERCDGEPRGGELDEILDSPVAPDQRRHEAKQRYGSYPQQADCRANVETLGKAGKSGKAIVRADEWVVKADPWRREDQVTRAGDNLCQGDIAAGVFPPPSQYVPNPKFERILEPGVVVGRQEDST